MTGLRTATTKELLEELGRRPVENVKAELVAMPVPCMLLTCAEYEADLARERAEGAIISEKVTHPAIIELRERLKEVENNIASSCQKAFADGLETGIRETKAQAGIDRFTSSCEVGTPSKAGVAKVYFDPANLVEAKQRAANALAVRDFMMGGGASQ